MVGNYILLEANNIEGILSRSILDLTTTKEIREYYKAYVQQHLKECPDEPEREVVVRATMNFGGVLGFYSEKTLNSVLNALKDYKLWQEHSKMRDEYLRMKEVQDEIRNITNIVMKEHSNKGFSHQPTIFVVYA